MVYKLISSKKIIAKVFADLNLREGDYRISDMMEWAAEGFLKIGAISSLIPKTTGRDGLPLLKVENYQVQLPCDFHSINFLSFSKTASGQMMPMRVGTGAYDANPVETESTDSTIIGGVIPEYEIIRTAQRIFDWNYAEAVENLNINSDLKLTIKDLLLDKKSTKIVDYATFHGEYTFIITNGYIKTNVRDGYLMLSYNALPVDAEGYIMIPDLESYIEAIYWYINMKLSYSEWRLGQIPTNVYEHSEGKWRFYARQAYGQAMMPDNTKITSLINQWNKLIPSFNEDHSAYSNLGRQELVYNVNVT